MYLYATVKTHIKEVYGWRFIAAGTVLSMAQPVLSMKGRGRARGPAPPGARMGAGGLPGRTHHSPFRLAARHFAAPRWFAGGQTRLQRLASREGGCVASTKRSKRAVRAVRCQ